MASSPTTGPSPSTTTDPLRRPLPGLRAPGYHGAHEHDPGSAGLPHPLRPVPDRPAPPRPRVLGADRVGRPRAPAGAFLLRIEDIDLARCRPEFEAAILDDLAGSGSPGTSRCCRQSEHLDALRRRAGSAERAGPAYPCLCTRADIRAAIAAAAGARRPPEPRRPRLSRHLPRPRHAKTIGEGDAVRLDLARALAASRPPRLARDRPGMPVTDRLDRRMLLARLGDVVLARKDVGAAAYHLAVVVDDALQGVTLSSAARNSSRRRRCTGCCRPCSTCRVPVWHHHRLIRDPAGRRLAKRDGTARWPPGAPPARPPPRCGPRRPVADPPVQTWPPSGGRPL